MEYQWTKMPWLSFPQNWCYYSSKTFAKRVHLVVQISCLAFIGVKMYFNDFQQESVCCKQRRSSRPPNPPIGGPRPTLGAQVSLKLLFGYVTIFSSADLFTTDLNCRKKLACDIISELYVILSRRI